MDTIFISTMVSGFIVNAENLSSTGNVLRKKPFSFLLKILMLNITDSDSYNNHVGFGNAGWI